MSEVEVEVLFFKQYLIVIKRFVDNIRVTKMGRKNKSRKKDRSKSSSQSPEPSLPYFTLKASTTMTEGLENILIKVCQDETYYHKFIITGKNRTSRRNIFKSLMDIVNIDTFQPINFFVSPQSTSFLAKSCLDVIKMIIYHKFKIPDYSDRKRILEFTILINFAEAKKQPVTEFIGANLWDVIKKRKTSESVNLNNFCEDLDLDHFYLLDDNKTLLLILSWIAKWDPKEVILSNNYISDLTHFILLSKSVTSLDLNNNLIRDVESLKVLGFFKKLTALDLRGNPVCDNFDYAWQYKLEIRKICPNLTVLDGADVYENVNFDYKKNFVCCDDAGELTSVFLEHFFTLYDSPERYGLFPLYNSLALFSVTASIIPNQANSDSVDLRHYGLNEPYVVSKVSEIMKLFAEFPRSYHDPYPMVSDVILFTKTTACIIVSGIFRELRQVLSFTRSFFFWRVGDVFRITNEQLHVSNATDFQMGWSFTFPVDVKYFGNPLPYHYDQYEKLEEVLCKITNMNVIYARKYLVYCNYDLKRTLQVFSQLHVNNEVPAAAFEFMKDDEVLSNKLKMPLNKYLRKKVMEEQQNVTPKSTWMTLNRERIKSSNDALPETLVGKSAVVKLYRTPYNNQARSKVLPTRPNVVEIKVLSHFEQNQLLHTVPKTQWSIQQEPSVTMPVPPKEIVKKAPSTGFAVPASKASKVDTAKNDPLVDLANRMAQYKELALKAIEDLKAKETSANPMASNPMIGSASNLQQVSKVGLQDSASRVEENSPSSSKQSRYESTSPKSDENKKFWEMWKSGVSNVQKPSASVAPLVKGTINNDIIQKMKENIQEEKACAEKIKSKTFEKEKRIASFKERKNVSADEVTNSCTEHREPKDTEVIQSSKDTEVKLSEKAEVRTPCKDTDNRDDEIKPKTSRKRKSTDSRRSEERESEGAGVRKDTEVTKSSRYTEKRESEKSLKTADVKQSQSSESKTTQVKRSLAVAKEKSNAADVKQSQLDDVKKQSQKTNFKESRVLSEPTNTGKHGSAAEKEEQNAAQKTEKRSNMRDKQLHSAKTTKTSKDSGTSSAKASDKSEPKLSTKSKTGAVTLEEASKTSDDSPNEKISAEHKMSEVVIDLTESPTRKKISSGTDKATEKSTAACSENINTEEMSPKVPKSTTVESLDNSKHLKLPALNDRLRLVQLVNTCKSKENLDTKTNSTTSESMEVSGESKISVEDAVDPAVKKLKLSTDTTTDESPIENKFKRPHPKSKSKRRLSPKREQKDELKELDSSEIEHKRELVVKLQRMTIEEIKRMVPYQNLPSYFIKFAEEKKPAQDFVPKPTVYSAEAKPMLYSVETEPAVYSEKAEPRMKMKSLKILLSRISIEDIKKASLRPSSQPKSEDNVTNKMTVSTINPVESNSPTPKQEKTSNTKIDDKEQKQLKSASLKMEEETIEIVSAINPVESNTFTSCQISKQTTSNNTKTDDTEQKRLKSAPTQLEEQTIDIVSAINPVASNPSTSFQISKQEKTSDTKTDDTEQKLLKSASLKMEEETIEIVSAINPVESSTSTSCQISKQKTRNNTKTDDTEQKRLKSAPTQLEEETIDIVSAINPVGSNPSTSFQISKQEKTSNTKTDDTEQKLLKSAHPQMEEETDVQIVSAINPVESNPSTSCQISKQKTTSNTKSDNTEQKLLKPLSKKKKNKKRKRPKTSGQPSGTTDWDVTSIVNPVNKLSSKFKIPKLSEKIANLSSDKKTQAKKNKKYEDKETRPFWQNYSDDGLSYRNAQRIAANKSKRKDESCRATSSKRLDNEEILNKNYAKREDNNLLKKGDSRTQMKTSTADSKSRKLIKEEDDTMEIEDTNSTNVDQVKTQNIKFNLISKLKSPTKKQVHESKEVITAITEISRGTTLPTDGLGTITVEDKKSIVPTEVSESTALDQVKPKNIKLNLLSTFSKKPIEETATYTDSLGTIITVEDEKSIAPVEVSESTALDQAKPKNIKLNLLSTFSKKPIEETAAHTDSGLASSNTVEAEKLKNIVESSKPPETQTEKALPSEASKDSTSTADKSHNEASKIAEKDHTKGMEIPRISFLNMEVTASSDEDDGDLFSFFKD
ncbi:uncharacterized protein LOC114339806 isoform X2 [Diabrotica virgifera virgifera]|uniref:Leucine-rich repeat-containing protein DDB_G0290503 n=1 Tax=Diabrotica virgifera virgifera TaxID=50390 RepID=A0ABM5JWX2_DIAVI|nr:uncharacterized protein LOC114339806 isoform X2 [Diabrotica virgifera virgifera]